MVKQAVSLRMEPYLLSLVKHLAENMDIGNKTALIEIAIKEFCERNKDKVQSQEFKSYMDFMRMENARANTKLQMRKATFKHNAVRKLKKLMRDGITQNRFEELVFVWCDEAEANGMTKEEFLSSFEKELNNLQGGGINEF